MSTKSKSGTQQFILFVTYKWTQHAGVLHYARMEKFARDKHSSLLDPFEGHKEKEVLWIQFHVSYLQHFIFFITYEWTQHAEVLHYTRLRKLARDIDYSFLDPFVSHKAK
jgi:hypothetical protein